MPEELLFKEKKVTFAEPEREDNIIPRVKTSPIRSNKFLKSKTNRVINN